MDIMAVSGRNYLITVDFYSDFWELDTLPNSPTAASLIQCSQRNFICHGIPDVVVADIWQFDYKKFDQFAKEREFECTPSDPYHSQSKGKAESAVKAAKKLIKKSEQGGSDLWIGLDWIGQIHQQWNQVVVQNNTWCLAEQRPNYQQLMPYWSLVWKLTWRKC